MSSEFIYSRSEILKSAFLSQFFTNPKLTLNRKILRFQKIHSTMRPETKIQESLNSNQPSNFKYFLRLSYTSTSGL